MEFLRKKWLYYTNIRIHRKSVSEFISTKTKIISGALKKTEMKLSQQCSEQYHIIQQSTVLQYDCHRFSLLFFVERKNGIIKSIATIVAAEGNIANACDKFGDPRASCYSEWWYASKSVRLWCIDPVQKLWVSWCICSWFIKNDFCSLCLNTTNRGWLWQDTYCEKLEQTKYLAVYNWTIWFIWVPYMGTKELQQCSQESFAGALNLINKTKQKIMEPHRHHTFVLHTD